jgi:hypothetical protein
MEPAAALRKCGRFDQNGSKRIDSLELVVEGPRDKPYPVSVNVLTNIVLSHTWAIAKYSIGAAAALVARIKKIAAFLDAPSISAMARGPTSLQMRSIRRILALRPDRPCQIPYHILIAKGSQVSEV